MASRVEKLISSDLNFRRIKESLKLPDVEYQAVDADAIEGVFKPNTFDLIFSSNVLEHVRDPSKVLKSTLPMLADSGYAVHIIPSRPIKIFYLLFYYPSLLLLAMDRIWGKLQGKPIFRGASINLENNINTSHLATSSPSGFWGKLRRHLFPKPHGNFPTHYSEFIAFGRKQWELQFAKAGYLVFSYAKGPVFSGYGFGFGFLRRALERLGVSSEHIFILQKRPSKTIL